MWPQPFINESNNKSIDERGDKNDNQPPPPQQQQEQKFDFSEPFKIPNKQLSTREIARSLFSQLNYPIVVTAAGDMMFTFEKPPVRLNGILHRAVDSIVRGGGSSSFSSSSSSSSSSAESSSSQSSMDMDSQIVSMTSVPISSSFQRSLSPVHKQTQQQQRDSSSNSILAALKSLGTTKSNTKFNSIFIKPKTAKHIGINYYILVSFQR